MEHLNRLIKLVIKKISVNKSLEPDGFTAEFYQMFKEEFTQILHKLFQKM
jgi:hypothetical protein